MSVYLFDFKVMSRSICSFCGLLTLPMISSQNCRVVFIKIDFSAHCLNHYCKAKHLVRFLFIILFYSTIIITVNVFVRLIKPYLFFYSVFIHGIWFYDKQDCQRIAQRMRM